MQAWRALDKATVELDGQTLLAHTKVRRDRIDKTGCFTLRYRSKLHHVGVGREHKGKRVLILMADLDVRVIDEDGVMIRHLELDPSVDYQGRSRISSEGSRVPENLRHHTVEVKGLEPSASTLRMCGSQCLDKVLSVDLPGSGVAIPSGSSRSLPFPRGKDT